MNDELAQDPALVQEFLIEATEMLQRFDQDMIALESTPGDPELLNSAFRALHTIKGTSGFLGFDPIIRVSHAAEDVLNQLRRGEVALSRPLMDLLLRARDQLGAMLNDLETGALGQYPLDELIAELKGVQALLQASKPDPGGKSAPEAQEQSAKAEKPESASKQPAVPGNNAGASTMRVDAHKLDELINLIGELVLERNRLAQLSRDFSSGRTDPEIFEGALSQCAARLSFITEELQASGLRTRMVPIETVFRKFPRLVRDVANNLQKQVQLQLRGEDTELDKTMVELISDPLVHLIRNSLDHGVETPQERATRGKPPTGTIRLEARQEGDQILIAVSDDGRGMDANRIGAKALEKGLVTPERLRTMNPREVLDFVFLPGFSTAERVNDVSGRGVGMDVVRTNLKRLNGTIEVNSRPGEGTTVVLRLPLTLAILPVLLVEVRDEIYALPLRAVIETASISAEQVHGYEGERFLCMRDQTLPLLRLATLFDRDADARESDKVVILSVAEKRIALLVDRLIGQESTVIKPLGNLLHNCGGVAGATISGDGRVRLVLDPSGLLAAATQSVARGASA